jgi:hypothetical protein
VNYVQLAINVDRQLSKAGQLVTVKRYAPSRNSSTGAVTKGTASLTSTAYAVEIPVTAALADKFASMCEPGTLTSKTVRAFKISPLLTFQPAARDEVTLADGTIWPVVGCTPVQPNGTPLVYTVGVAK